LRHTAAVTIVARLFFPSDDDLAGTIPRQNLKPRPGEAHAAAPGRKIDLCNLLRRRNLR